MTLRAVVAMMEHETNTFSPVPTPLERFGHPEVPRGEEALRLAQTERVDAFQLQASALAYLALGREQEAVQTIETLIDTFHKGRPYTLFYQYRSLSLLCR